MKLELKSIEKSFGEKRVLKGISFSAESGKAFGLLGRNGAGKTTSIRILMDVFPANSDEVLIDGTNASDDAADRPGIRALRELSVRSPLRECGITKADVRRLSKEAGIFTWNKPSYACLATRIPAGESITAEKLQKTEQSEAFLTDLGFHDFRVRLMGESAKLQIREEQFPLLIEKRTDILNGLKSLYTNILLDLEVRG